MWIYDVSGCEPTSGGAALARTYRAAISGALNEGGREERCVKMTTI